MNEYTSIHLSRIHDRLYKACQIIDEARSQQEITPELPHELSLLRDDFSGNSPFSQDLKEVEEMVYRQMDREGESYGNK